VVLSKTEPRFLKFTYS